jgi:hypothetical protein
MYYQIKVNHRIEVDNGKTVSTKRVNSTYCFDDEGIESCVIKALAYFNDELTDPIIKSVSDSVIIEYVGNSKYDRLYQCRVHFILVDDKGKEKKSAEYFLVSGNSLKTVEEIMVEKLKTSVQSYEIHSITLSSVKAVIE